MDRRGVILWLAAVVLAGILLGQAGAGVSRIQSLLQDATQLEKQAEWAKALAVYDAILRIDRNRSDAKQLYQKCLRRFWQAHRHQDLSFRQEVLSLEYNQALRLYGIVLDTLLENDLRRKKQDAGGFFRKGLEELNWGLSDPAFCREHLRDAKPEEIREFQSLLVRTWGNIKTPSKAQAMRQVREIALTAQAILNLDTTVAVMEFTCGACYGFDDYTAYLTPTQLRELCDSLRGEFMPSVAYHLLPDATIGYVQITSFRDSTLQELDTALAMLRRADMKALILDLRGNGGGLFETAVDAARKFLVDGVITSTQHQDPKLNAIYHARNPNACAVPLVVLIDGDTASAAEVLAGALKENNRARLVGETTFGKGCSQTLITLPPATGGVPTGGMRITVTRFFSPSGLPYSGRGVEPHVFVERGPMPESLSALDLQLDQARLEALRLLEAR